MIDWKIYYKFDFFAFILALCLAGFGLVIIAGATGDVEGDTLFVDQFQRVILGIFCLLAVTLVEYRTLVRFAPLIYILGLLSLLFCFVPYVGLWRKGAYSWVNIAGVFQIQPGEFAKLCTILMLTRILSTKKDQWQNLWGILRPLLIGCLPSLIILKQPDLGTAIVFGPITLLMMLVAGMPLAYFLILFSPLLGLFAISSDPLVFLCWLGCTMILLLVIYLKRIHWSIWVPFVSLGLLLYATIYLHGESIWEKLPPHQKGRIVGYLNPDFEPMSTNFNINQSKIALGSGGFWGKGVGKGTQTQLEFLPEYRHDFVFSALGEQVGFLGSGIVLGIFLLLIIRGLDTATETKTLQGALIATGIVSLYFTHIFINVGMATGLLPVTGLPLTFISYGGTFMLSNMIGVGLLINIRMRTSSELLKDSFSSGRPAMAIPSTIADDF
ncbi:MAG: FtsW/RodA/SpoVE family cell cycle protein [bacterium]|nr:FtsW/RodA/SpoVE family cell cycle protein [bacterium]